MEQSTTESTTFSIVRMHCVMLEKVNFHLSHDSRILEFGCGSGAAVYEYRDAGFNACGFDITNYVKLRQPEDMQYFRFALTGKPANIPEYIIDSSFYKIPFDDEQFDFSFSNSVFEHVMHYHLALAENARVLRQGGMAIHIFPARYAPIEPHMYVPLGGVIQHYLWYLLWAYLGVRNEYQHHLTPVEVAQANQRYAKTGINYVPLNAIQAISRQYFRDVRLAPHLWEMSADGSLTVRSQRLLRYPFLRWLYNHTRTVVLILRK